jgi:hypothetical protein
MHREREPFDEDQQDHSRISRKIGTLDAPDDPVTNVICALFLDHSISSNE